MWAQYGLLKIMQMMGSITLLFVASITFLFISPLIGILIIFFVLFCSFLILNFTKSKISKFAEIKRNSSTGSITSLNQIFRGIKDIRVSKSEDYFKKQYLNNFYVYGSSGIKLNFFQNISPIIIMALGQTGIIIIAIILWASNYSGSEIASIMAIFVLVTSRVLPNVNRLINDLNGIWNAYPNVISIQQHKNDFINLDHNSNIKYKSMVLNWSSLKMINVYFKYPNTKEYVLKNINFNLERGKSYAEIGQSGSGKSTVIDLIIGLLRPTKGKILIDGTNVEKINNQDWLSQIGMFHKLLLLLMTH